MTHQRISFSKRNKLTCKIRKRSPDRRKSLDFSYLNSFSQGVLRRRLSADSRIRVVDGFEQVHRFKGFQNTNSQISAYLAAGGRYVISASEDSRVYIWRSDDNSEQRRSKGIASVTNSYEHFYCQDVTVAVALEHVQCWSTLGAKDS